MPYENRFIAELPAAEQANVHETNRRVEYSTTKVKETMETNLTGFDYPVVFLYIRNPNVLFPMKL